MENILIMDNDSGYVSHNAESNLDSSTENMCKLKMHGGPALYFSEDALLEKPSLRSNSATKLKPSDSFDSFISGSQESLKTNFSGFEDSDESFVIPEINQIVWSLSEHKENVPPTPKKITPSRKSPPHKALANLTNTYQKTETPTKTYVNMQTSNVSPDLFGDEEPEKRSPIKKPRQINQCVKDVKLVKNVQNSLSGVHPPPNITIIQTSVTEMLEKLKENESLWWKSCTSTTEVGKSLLVSDKEECVTSPWPDVLKSRFHGLHYNRNKLSEDFEHLCLKYAERYVGAETQSSCTVFEASSSSQKRRTSRPKWCAKSPGRRLSHLARRRITFSSSSLQTNSSSAILGSRARQILVDARKLSVLRKSPNKKSPRKTPSKSPFKVKKKTPSSSAKKKLALRFREMSGEFENILPSSSDLSSSRGFKRALFNSGNEPASIEKKSTKRALFSSPLKNSPHKKSPLDKKRKRTDSEKGNAPKLYRSISESHSSKKPDSTTLHRTFSELSDQHKKKLQWAVYKSLHLQNIAPTHPQYKVFASVLAKLIRKFLPNLRCEGGTTEKMFKIARQHSHAVVKGKTVDEIFNECMKNRKQKVQGYVGLEEFKKETNEKGNILQDKMNILESIEKRREFAGAHSSNFSQNRIDRIKKKISFEDKQ